MVLSHGWPDDIAKRDGGAILNHHRTVHGIGCGWNESIERQPLAFSGTDSLDLKLLEWKYQFFHYRILTLIFLRNFILPLSAWTSTDSHQILNKQKSPWVSSPTKLKTPPPRRLTLEEDTPPWSNSVPSACTRRSPPAVAVPKWVEQQARHGDSCCCNIIWWYYSVSENTSNKLPKLSTNRHFNDAPYCTVIAPFTSFST